MNSFIKWIGGKKSLRKNILAQFPEPQQYDRYIEVFGGAGWILFSRDRHAKKEVYNDINGELVNLYRCVKYHAQELQRELEFLLMSREQFNWAKGQNAEHMTDIQRASRFYILIKESYGCDLRSFGVRGINLLSAVDYLKEVAVRLSGVVIENRDFEKLIKTYDCGTALFYLDPPYYGTEKYYSGGFGEADHVRLKNILEKISGMFILSYNDCDFVRDLYKDYKILEVSRPHNLLAKTEACRYKELIIKNF